MKPTKGVAVAASLRAVSRALSSGFLAGMPLARGTASLLLELIALAADALCNGVTDQQLLERLRGAKAIDTAADDAELDEAIGRMPKADEPDHVESLVDNLSLDGPTTRQSRPPR